MKTFREHLNEEVSIGALSSGGIDIERDAVRDEINGILSGIAARPCVTPYASLNKIRKALAYFHIHLPKKVYLEGRHGVEVWEVSQFGDKMGVTNTGEWIKDVPAKFYLFFHYHLVGSMYFLQAKIVDDKELETKVSNAERMVAEEMDAAARQNIAKARAPKEDPHTALGDCDCSQGDSPSTKDAVKVSMKKIEEGQVTGPRSYKGSPDRKRKAVQMALGRKHKDHPDWNPRTNPQYSALKLGRKLQKQGVTEDNDPCWKGYEMVGMKKKGGRKVPNCVPVEEEKSFNEMTPSEKMQWMKDQVQKGKEEKKRLRKSLREKPKKNIKEEQIDEVSAGLAQRAAHRAFVKSDKMKADAKKEPDMHSYVQAVHKGEKKNKQGTKFAKYAAKKMEEEQIDEKAPPGAKFERMVKHIKKGYSKDGLTAKEKSIAYATAWKAKKREENK